MITRHPVPALLAWFFTAGQAIAFAPVVLPDLPTAPFIIAATFIGFLLPAVAITRIVDGILGLVHAAANAVALGSVLGEGVLPRLYGDDSSFRSSV